MRAAERLAGLPVPPPASRRPRQLINVASNWAAFLVATAVNFLLAPFVIHSLGDTEYGAWVLLASLVGYLGLLDLGVRGAVTRYVARYHGSGTDEAAARLTSTALTALAAAGVIAVALAVGVAFGPLALFQVPAELQGVARIVVIVAGVNVAVALLGGAFGGIVIGLQRFELSNGVEIAVQGVRGLAIFFVLRAGGGLVALAVTQLCCSLLRTGADVALSRRLYPQLRARLGGWDGPAARLIVSFGLSSSVIQAMARLIFYSDALVIGVFLPIAMVTYFAIAASLVDYGRALVAGISQTMTPLAGGLEGGGNADQVRDVLLDGARFATLIVLPVVVTFGFRGNAFLALWIGPEYAERSGPVLTILAVALWSFASYQVATSTLMGLDRHRQLVPVFVAEAIANVALSAVLVQRYGIVGAAWGTLLPRLVVSGFVVPLYLHRSLGIAPVVFWTRVWVRPALAMAPFAVVSVAVERLAPATDLPTYFAQVGATIPAAALGTWVVCLSAAERLAYGQQFRATLAWARRRLSQSPPRHPRASPVTRKVVAVARALRGHPLLSPTAVLEAWRERRGGRRAVPDHGPHLRAALDWIERAQDVTASGGIAWGYSLTWNLHFRARGWHPPYPEVTGYLIPTLYLAAAHLGRRELAERAERAARWETRVQLASGAVRGGVMGEEETPVVFNTGQVLLGWLSALEVTGDATFGDAARRAGRYLLNALGPDGHWRCDDETFARPGVKLYNARSAWALAEAGARLGEPTFVSAAARSLHAVARQQYSNGWLPNCCLDDPERPLLHTLAYAIRGLLEGGRVLSDDRLVASAARAAGRLAEIVVDRGWIAGRLHADWSPAVTWRCLTGEAQMVNNWMRLHAITGDGRWLQPVPILLGALKSTQNLTSGNPGLRGGIKGSAPIGGGYAAYQVLSWATKFFADALIRDEQMGRGPRAGGEARILA